MPYTTRRAIIIAITEGNQTIKQTALKFGKSERQIRRYLNEWKKHGVQSLEPKSRVPHNKPTKTPLEIENQIIKLRKTILAQGLDARVNHPRTPKQAYTAAPKDFPSITEGRDIW